MSIIAVSDPRINSLLTEAAGILENRLYPEVPPCELLREKYYLSDEFGKKILSYKKYINAQRKRKNLKIMILVAALISVLAAFALGMGAKEKIMLFMSTFNISDANGSLEYTSIEGGTGDVSSEGEEKTYELYVPEGFELDSEYRGLPGELMYRNGEKFYVFALDSVNGMYAADTEYHKLKQIQIKDSIIYYFEDKENGYTFMVGQIPRGSISIRGNITLEDGIRIIESAM